MTQTSGYWGTPLVKKLGLKAGQDVVFIGLPKDLEALAAEITFASCSQLESAGQVKGPADFIHAFYDRADAFRAALPVLKAAIRPAGMIWISWPKKASKVPTDLTENDIRNAALAEGLVDIKVCAVSEVWSGLKLVIPVASRRETV